jgi:hypothetical protein
MFVVILACFGAAFFFGNPQRTSAPTASSLPSIHILDDSSTLAFTNWHVEGFDLMGTMVWHGPNKIDSITFTTRRNGVVQQRGDVVVPGGEFIKDEPTEVGINCWEDPAGLDLTIEVNY